MPIRRLIALSLKGLLKYKLRSFLMMLGVIIGIATLTVIISLAKGAEHKVMMGIQNFGANAVMASAGGGKMFGPPDGSTTTLTLDDAKALQESIKGIKIVAPFTMNLSQTVVYGNRNTDTAVVGVTPEFADAWQWYAAKGDFISDEDLSGLTKNCVLGQTVAKELFGDQNPIGETVRLNNTNLKVIGVLTKRGASPHGMDMDNRVVVPLSTAMRRLFNTTALGMIRLYVDDPSRLDEVTTNVTAILRERHHITPPQEDDFRVTNSMAVANTVKGVSKTLTTFLLLLASVSLIVGGIVIANIMFISVNERKKEIGIRRAFGARAKDIRQQFLGEALIVSLCGGIGGALIGIAVTFAIALIKKMPAMLSWQPFALAILFSTVVGVIAGSQPARKAAAMEPVEAIKG
jgi:putative ABC transport system permease protein